jgi:hypothetical protein
MRIGSGVGVTVSLLVVFCGAIAAEPQQCPRTIPANIQVAHDLARVLEDIYRRSATFRAQCERIAAADSLSVKLRIDTAMPSRCRAYTIVQRRGYDIVADVRLPPTNALIELIGHEFEHLLEQIEGIDLKRLARVKGSGVHAVEGRAFETDRAQAAGLLVLAETDRARRRARTAD